MTDSPSSGITMPRRLSRRRFVAQAGGLAAGAALAHSATGPWFHRARAQGSGFTREASITSWGFGAEETNPMALSLIYDFRQTCPNIQLELVQ